MDLAGLTGRAIGNCFFVSVCSFSADLPQPHWSSTDGDGDECKTQSVALGLDIQDLPATGLTQLFVVHFKLLTLNKSLLLGVIGRLSTIDQSGVLGELSVMAAVSPAG